MLQMYHYSNFEVIILGYKDFGFQLNGAIPAIESTDSFHDTHCRYFYRLLSGSDPLSILEKDRAWHVPEELDLRSMQVRLLLFLISFSVTMITISIVIQMFSYSLK